MQPTTQCVLYIHSSVYRVGSEMGVCGSVSLCVIHTMFSYKLHIMILHIELHIEFTHVSDL